MSVFKNEVGRPSNETKKKRRIIIGGSILALILLVATFYFAGLNSGVKLGANSVDTSKLTSAISQYGSSYTFGSGASVSVKGRSLRYWLTTLLGTPVSKSYARAEIKVVNSYSTQYTLTCTDQEADKCSEFKFEWHKVKRNKDTIVSRNMTYSPSFLEKYYCIVTDSNNVSVRSATVTWSYLL